MSFSFSFSGDDIDEDIGGGGGGGGGDDIAAEHAPSGPAKAVEQQPSTISSSAGASAFPVQGKPLLPPTVHDLGEMLSSLPSKIAYGLLHVDLDGKGVVPLPRRELWDVRVQLMAEDAEDTADAVKPGLGKHDVKTGIYEGGFKSWESSVDLVKVLAAENFSEALSRGPCKIIELGCGTALPSLALFNWAGSLATTANRYPVSFILADYNPSVLFLVTLPNFILAWALHQQEHNSVLQQAFTPDGELELTTEVLESFRVFLNSSQISLTFLSGGWSPEFVQLLYDGVAQEVSPGQTLVLGAETIYSPFALASFADTLVSILQREKSSNESEQAVALIAAKRLYFGVGGSLDDFVDKIQSLGVTVALMREETEGVRRGVVKCSLP